MSEKPSCPPVLAERALQAMPGHGEDYAIVGDLNEEYALRARKMGESKARGWYWSPFGLYFF
jgi:hypothetical protein